MCSLTRKTVLIVDDGENIRDFLSDFFAQYGYQPSVATNGKEAMDLLRKESFELLITDFNMPEMSGIDLIRTVKKYDIKLTIIGMSVEDNRKDFLEAGADFFVLKPFNFEHLSKILKSVYKV